MIPRWERSGAPCGGWELHLPEYGGRIVKWWGIGHLWQAWPVNEDDRSRYATAWGAASALLRALGER